MKNTSRMRQLLKPSLGKVGLIGMTLCLALGMFAPPAPTDVAAADALQAKRPQLVAQIKQIPTPRH